LAEVERLEHEPPAEARETIGSYLESARLLGQRTGELHVALGSGAEGSAFAPEPFTALYRRSVYQGMRSFASQVLALLRKRLKNLPDAIRPDAEKILDMETEILNRFALILQRKIPGMRIRCHGDYHLGQVLYTGKDFVIIDFEGEPSRPLGERKLKRSPLRDVSGMLQSFRYASLSELKGGGYRIEDHGRLKSWSRFWYGWVSATFLKAYLAATRESGFLPGSGEDIGLVLHLYLLEKSIYELGYEINHRPDWMDIPIESIFEILK
jgi:maltose alpha-D-glucosyltransferase/alpha-amylase